MYVCVCKAVSDKTVKRAIADGACSVRELRDRLGVASGCGRCVPEIRTLLAESGTATGPKLSDPGFLPCMT